MFKLHGIYAPIATPFAGGEIAYDKLEKNLEFWLGSDLEGIVVMGSNGEFVLLSPQEKEELMRFVCAWAKGKKPVIAGTGAESTAETIRLNRKAAEAGADAVLVVTPNYYKGEMTDPVLARFYTDVADASPLPVILYNMPRNAGINISAKLAVELARHPNIIGIKDSGGNIVQIADMIRNAPEGFSVFAGSASYLYTSLALGATGGTLALANIFPNECARLQTLFDAGKIREARDLQMKLIDSNNAVTAR
jgi:4-hydroxy-2-oxoglutarate aldolase